MAHGRAAKRRQGPLQRQTRQEWCESSKRAEARGQRSERSERSDKVAKQPTERSEGFCLLVLSLSGFYSLGVFILSVVLFRTI